METTSEKKLAAAIFFLREESVLAGLRKRFENGKPALYWMLPGGRVEPTETVEAALAREVHEETGIRDFAIEEHLGIVPAAHHDSYDVHVFLGSTVEEANVCEPELFSEWRWIKIAELPSNFVSLASLELLKGSLANRKPNHPAGEAR